MKINGTLFVMAILFSSVTYNQSLIVENDTSSAITIRLNQSIISTPLISNQTMEFKPEEVKTIEFKYRGYPNFTFVQPNNLATILNNIKAQKKDAIFHVEAGRFGGVQLGKTEFVTPSSPK